MSLRLVCVSDTHLQHDFPVPEGDVLIHAGDLTFRGDRPEISRAVEWLRGVKVGGGFKEAVIVPGNHDWMAERDPNEMRVRMEEAGMTYLDHLPAEVLGLRFFGSGYTPAFFDWALNVKRGPDLARLWAQIPDDTQVLVTHGPPMGRLDVVRRPDGDPDSTYYGTTPKVRHIETHVGCADLRDRIRQLRDLKLHVFGHIHKPGRETGADGVTYVNASICDQSYKAVHAPIVVDL